MCYYIDIHVNVDVNVNVNVDVNINGRLRFENTEICRVVFSAKGLKMAIILLIVCSVYITYEAVPRFMVSLLLPDSRAADCANLHPSH